MTEYEYEMKMLRKRMNTVWQRAQKMTKKLLGENHTLQWLGELDRMRLVILLTWEERYCVSVEEILEFLLPYYQSVAKKQKVKKVMGLPVTVQTLVSKTTEQILKKHLEEEYPVGVKERIQRQAKQELWIRHLQEKEMGGVNRVKRLKDFETFADYQKYYDNHIQKTRRYREEVLEEMSHTLPYRGNPWR